MISVLVTGANGQLGQCLKDVALNHKDIEWVFKTSKELDITDPKSIQTLFDQKNFDYLVNCAAYTAVDKAESEKEKTFLVNAEAVKYLAETCNANNAVFIHISTDFVFDGSKNTAYQEGDKTNPINVYGASKLKGEQYIQEILDKYFIIRTSWVYSEHGHNFVKTMLRLGKERNEISVVSDQIGSPTYAKDLALLLAEIIESQTTAFGLYNYSNEGAISWYDFAKAIFEQSNLDLKVSKTTTENYPTPAKRPSYSLLDKSKIKKALKLEIPNWKDSLDKVLIKISE
ncbi:dTDP-4-dehydrorhamnose reductase [Jejuia spongiicola]|uniref:dTDP-4-dehydrorhamnose reductase n=1 Tax=Jejuia spongiicola TaxID=2942207 RepID=A0ABT0QBT1_9FLAO|nr:dTDP-4-dehydrorhamnose reductase [Jejuia spongiicola]MCL6293425.1 dTDP-4-dehydrorhamnose reductase [Jejuia spongiicola]